MNSVFLLQEVQWGHEIHELKKKNTPLQKSFVFSMIINGEIIIRSRLNIFTHQTCSLLIRDDISLHEVSVHLCKSCVSACFCVHSFVFASMHVFSQKENVDLLRCRICNPFWDTLLVNLALLLVHHLPNTSATVVNTQTAYKIVVLSSVVSVK